MKNGLCMYLFPSFGWFTKGGVGELKGIPICFKASDIHCYTDFQKGCYQVTPEGKWGRTIRAWICRKYLVAIFLFKNNNAFLFWTHRNGYAFFMCVCVCARSCLTLCNPMDCSPPDSSVHGIFQARILVWVAISFSRRSSWPRDRICVSCDASGFFTTEPPRKPVWNLIFDK